MYCGKADRNEDPELYDLVAQIRRRRKEYYLIATELPTVRPITEWDTISTWNLSE